MYFIDTVSRLRKYWNECCAMLHAKDEKLKQLWQEFVAKQPTDDEVLEVVKTVPELNSAAGELLLTRNPAAHYLFTLILYAPQQRVRAGKRLLELAVKDPAKELNRLYLFEIAERVPELFDEVCSAVNYGATKILFEMKQISQDK